MPKKNTSTSRALTEHQPPAPPVARTMNGGKLLVPVDAVFRVRDLHPRIEGPWSVEADKIAWMDALSGYPCIIRRSSRGGHLGGYVAVPSNHPLYGMEPYAFAGLGIAVHGGIGYAASCQRWEPEERSICHVHQTGPILHANAAALQNDDAWWLGFECNQPGDVVPNAMAPRPQDKTLHGVNERTYKTESFVYDECVRLASQLKAVEEGRDAGEADPGSQSPYYDPWRIGQ